jgi:hypothetical protein
MYPPFTPFADRPVLLRWCTGCHSFTQDFSVHDCDAKLADRARIAARAASYDKRMQARREYDAYVKAQARQRATRRQQVAA